MSTPHLTEAEIQAYALGKANLNQTEHIGFCTLCETRAENYRLIFSVMDELPQPALDFDVATLVVSRLPQPEIANEGSDRWIYVTACLALALLGFPVYFNLDYLLRMVNGIVPAALYLVMLISLVFLVSQGVEMYRKHQKKMNALNFE